LAPKWTGPGAANIEFQFVDRSEDALIRISFKTGVCRTHLGRSAELNKDQSSPTLELHLQGETTDYRHYLILHEFGHALGLAHEHQSPKADIPWNRQAIYDYWTSFNPPRPNTWVNREYLDVLPEAEVGTSDSFDIESVMMYRIDAGWVTDSSFRLPSIRGDLSATDKAYIKKCYP
jgi:hypothetical protein